MIKKILLLAIVSELVLFYFIYTEKQPMPISNAPYKAVDSGIQKAMPAQEVFERTLEMEAESATTAAATSLDQIKSKYQSLFEELEVESHSKLEKLAATVFAELKENGLDLTSLGALTEYADEFKLLEKETDLEFEQLYQQLEAELTQNGFAISEGNHFKQVYESKKKDLMEEIMGLMRNKADEM